MGASSGVHYKTVKNDAGFVKCAPEACYRIFPTTLNKPAGSLVLATDAFQMANYRNRQVDPGSIYWWTDAQFLPNDDSTLFMTTGAFVPRSHQSWAGIHHVPPGRIHKLDLNNLSSSYFNNTRMTNYPKIQMHPSGKYFLYIGYECIKIETIDHEEVYNKFKDLRNCNYRSCAFSPDGSYVAILLSAPRSLEISLSMLDRGLTFHDRDADLTRMFPDFRVQLYNEHVECKWSSDSEHIAICSSFGFLFVLNKNLELVVDITGSTLPETVFPSWSSTFDYDPRSYHDIMAVGTSNRCVYIINTDTQQVLAESDVLTPVGIDCVVYHPKGDNVAVSTRDFNIYLLDSEDAQVTFQINMRFHVPDLEPANALYPAVMRLSFTSAGDHIASSSCDGKVRIWQLPVQTSLFELCKLSILSHVPQTKLQKLPLPAQILSKLLFVSKFY